MTKRKTTKEAEAKAEMIYWATGRTKIYPEKNFAKNYAEIKARSEKKRETNFKDKPKNVVPKENVYLYPQKFMLERHDRYHGNSFVEAFPEFADFYKSIVHIEGLTSNL